MPRSYLIKQLLESCFFAKHLHQTIVGEGLAWLGISSLSAYSAGGNSGPRRTLMKKEKDHFFLKAQNP